MSTCGKGGRNSRRISTSVLKDLKLFRMSTYRKSDEGSSAANVYRPAAKVYQQDELPPCNKGELPGINKVGEGLSAWP
jgi:hypothetical protein